MKPVRGVRAALWLAKFLRDPVASMQEAYRRHGPLCVVGNALPRRRETLHVLALGPDFNRAVLGDTDLFHNSTPNPPGSALGRIGCGLTAMNGAKHRQQRQLVQPPFTRKAVDGYVADMVALIGPLIERWPSGGVVEIGGEMRRLALRSSARLLFGREDRDRVDAMGELIQEYLRRSGVPLRPGDRVACSPYMTHHLPHLYPEPERFDPGRWSTIDPGPYEYLPFGAGPRFCLGYSLAMTGIKVALALILQRWRLVVPGTRLDRLVRITMSPRHGLPMSVHPQDRRFRSVAVRGDIHEMVESGRPPGDDGRPGVRTTAIGSRTRMLR
jgi:cytochrome P450